MPKLAVFPKGFIDDLCVHKTMTLPDWIDLAATLDVDGTELYDHFFESFDAPYLDAIRRQLRGHDLAMPMLCYSPDFTQSDPAARNHQVENTRRMIDLCAEFEAVTCRVLSGQARPDLRHADGVDWTVGCIEALLPHAERQGIVLAIENHFKDGFWEYREFAQRLDTFLEILDRIDSPHLRVNYYPSNATVAGEDPIEFLQAVLDRVITVHASDRYVREGSLEDLRDADGTLGYAPTLRHGVIGSGLNDYNSIFGILAQAGFDGWVSIEDGDGGMTDLRDSVAFLVEKMRQHFPPPDGPGATSSGV